MLNSNQKFSKIQKKREREKAARQPPPDNQPLSVSETLAMREFQPYRSPKAAPQGRFSPSSSSVSSLFLKLSDNGRLRRFCPKTAPQESFSRQVYPSVASNTINTSNTAA